MGYGIISNINISSLVGISRKGRVYYFLFKRGPRFKKSFLKNFLLSFLILEALILFFPLKNITAAEDWCEDSVDLSKDFAPIKDQGDLGHCDAFASTALVENFSCRNDGKVRCNSLSALDTLSQIPGRISTKGDIFDIENILIGEGGTPTEDLEILRKNGLCLDKFARYDDFHNQYSVGENHAFLNLAYLMYQNKIYDSGVLCEDSIADETIRMIREDAGLKQYDSEFIRNRLRAAPNAREFVRMMVVPEECVDKRTKFDYEVDHLSSMPGGRRYFSPEVPYYPSSAQVSEFKNNIASRLKQNTPLIVDFSCGGSGVCPVGMSGGHAVVIKGMRKNPSSGQCELLIHNSWGKTWQDSHSGGWVEATPLIASSFEYDWID